MIQKIAYYTEYDISFPDGPGTNELEFVRQLSDNFGKNAWAFVPEPAAPVPLLQKINHVPCKAVKRLRELPNALFNARATAKEIASTCKDQHIDLVVTRLPALPLVPRLLATRHGLPLAVKTLGGHWFKGEKLSILESFLRKVQRRVAIDVFQNAVAMDSALPLVWQQAKPFAANEDVFCQIPNGVNTTLFTPGESALEGRVALKGHWPVLGFLGSLPSLRGARELVELASKIQKNYPQVAIVIAGWDEGMHEVAALAKALGVSKRCHFLGWVPYENAPDVIRLMDIGFSFFETPALSIEGNASQKVRQYLACGKPVISIPEGHAFLREHDLGDVVDPKDTASLERIVKHWIDRTGKDSSLQNRLSNFAREHLSTEQAFEQRLAFWNKRMEHWRPRA